MSTRSFTKVHCDPIEKDISMAMRKVSSEGFKVIAHNVVNPFGDGSTSSKMIEILKKRLSNNINIMKEFYDVRFEV